MQLSSLPPSQPAIKPTEDTQPAAAAPPRAAEEPVKAAALPTDQLQTTQTPKRGALQAVMSLWQSSAPIPVTAEDRTWAKQLEAKSLRGYHPSVDEMSRYHRVSTTTPVGAQSPQKLSDAVPAMKAIFSRIDRNGNGYLADAELKSAVRDPGIKGDQAIALATLLKLNGSIQKIAWNEFKPTSGVHQRDLSALASKATKSSPSRWTMYVESYVFSQSLKLKQTDPRLFPAGITSIRPDQIRQGDYGTCTILATASALASSPQGKQALLNMISEKADGSFEVRFPGEKPLAVKRPTDTELILYANAGSDGLWLSVLEKAFISKIEQSLAGKSPEEIDKALNGGLALSEGIRLLTGKPASEGFISQTPADKMRPFVAEQIKHGRLLLATLDPGSEQAKNKQLKKTTGRNEEVYSDGLVGLHAYSLIGYDPATDKVTLHNPWGNTEYGNDGVDDGIFSMPFADFHRLFSHLSWQSP